MIPLKMWNSLPQYKREKIIRLTYVGITEDYLKELSQEYHHNFNYDSKGAVLKSILQCCYSIKLGGIKVITTHYV